MRDPELVARAQHAAARLESAWERWRAFQGIGETPAQPVVGYVGYALKEPWGQPRAVIGFSADEAERLADFLERGSSEHTAVDRSRDSGQRPTPDQTAPPISPAKPAVQSDIVAVTSQLSGSQLGHRFLSGSGARLERQEPGSNLGPCRIRLGSGRPGPGPSPDSRSSREPVLVTRQKTALLLANPSAALSLGMPPGLGVRLSGPSRAGRPGGPGRCSSCSASPPAGWC